MPLRRLSPGVTLETLIHLAGAVALLLWGIRTVRTGVERMFGPQIESHIAVLTGRRLRAFGLGAVSGMALQSSTAATLMAASFCAGGVLALPAALAVALGAEVGSSLAVVLLNFDVKLLAPILLFAGYVVFTVSAERRGKNAGRITLGLAFILTALTFLGEAASGLSASPAAREIMHMLAAEPVVVVIATALLTWLMHSSIAVVLMTAQLVASGVVPLEGGLWMVVGANAGAALPALMAGWTIGGPARRLLLGAMTLRLTGVVIGATLLAIPGTVSLIEGLAGGVVLTHVALNLSVAAVALPFVGILATVIERVLPLAPVTAEAEAPAENIFLAPEDVSRPQTAFLNVANETSRVAHIVYGMIGEISDLFRDPMADARINALEADVDRLYRQVTLYMAAIKVDDLDPVERERWFELFEFITHLEHVGDIITRNIVSLAKRKRKTGLEFSSEGATELEGLTHELSDIFRHAQAVFLSRDPHRARALIDAKRRFRAHTLESQRRHAIRLSSGVKSSVSTSRIHLDLLRELRRINSHLTAVAYPLLERA